MTTLRATSRPHAFTLIELLIVVAVMAILTASMIAYITVPPQEERLATATMEQEAGLGAFFAKLAGDVHNAARLTPAPARRAVILEETGRDASTVYFIDAKDCLRRAVMTRAQAGDWAGAGKERIVQIDSARLAAGIKSMEATPIEDGRMWRIFVTLATSDPQRPALERGIEVAVGIRK